MSGQLKNLEFNSTSKQSITRTRKKSHHLSIPVEVNFLWEIRLTYATIGITFLAWAFATREFISILWDRIYGRGLFATEEQLIFILIANALIYGNLVYQFTRLGYLKRRSDHRPVDREELETIYEDFAPALTILVPSYKEDSNVVRRTLLSAALQDYPKRRVVLLIDDPPHPTDPSDQASLQSVRELPSAIRALLDPIGTRFTSAYDEYLERRVEGRTPIIEETLNIASLYREAAAWFDKQAVNYPVADPGDALLVEKVLAASAQAHHRRADELERAALAGGVSEGRALREYRRLAMLFQVEVTSFERKRYVNLSHEPNKAMNLNSYIGLIGKSFLEIKDKNGPYLERTNRALGNQHVPDADFLITLDADSLLVTDYALRLIHIMMQPGNEKVAVAQTPYSAIPSAPGTLERIAGATTDIQYIIHQGFTRFRATYWVGANALLRKQALEDIRVVDRERGFEITRYIQDRTVIEDTESSFDLIERNWQLYNYPERLAYSATPADFGALLIQRRRWANGGLIILPKLLRYLVSGPQRRSKLVEGFFRCHYLISIATVNIGLLIILAFPFQGSIRSFWLPLTAVPYFFLYGRDLVQIGYRWTDLLRVYALNLMLIPVNLCGVFKSIHQACTRQKIPFGRTPKVKGRTAAPAFYICAEFALLFDWAIGYVADLAQGRWIHASFILVNAAFLGYAVIHFIGLRESREDFLRGMSKKTTIQPSLHQVGRWKLEGAYETNVTIEVGQQQKQTLEKG